MRVFTFDTTLRDGTQGEAVSFSADDKILVVHKLDELGIDYIEGGWPGSNPKDKEFFAQARELTLKHARLVAFGATRFARKWIEENKTGRKNFLAMREEARRQPIEQVGAELRAMMPFLKKKKEAGVPEDQPALAAKK